MKVKIDRYPLHTAKRKQEDGPGWTPVFWFEFTKSVPGPGIGIGVGLVDIWIGWPKKEKLHHRGCTAEQCVSIPV